MSNATCPIQSGRVDRSCDFWVPFFYSPGIPTPDLILFTFLAAKNISTSSGLIFAGKSIMSAVATPIQSIELLRVEVTDFGLNAWTHLTAISP
jgi:hypothetical protein